MGDLTEELTWLEGEIRRMKIEFDRFFNGALPAPPEELRLELARALARVHKRHMSALADRFRFNALEARFNALSELYGRKLREHEAGLEAESSPARRPDPYGGVVFAGAASRDEALAIYEELYGAAGRTAKTDFASFFDFLEKKAAKIRKMTDCAAVQFRVVEQQGRLALKAKPIKNSGS